MDTARKLRESGFAGHIILTTTSRDHAVESYNIDADGYLVKPFSYEDFSRSFEKVMKKLRSSFKSILIKSDRIEFRIFLNDIDYIESGDHCSFIHARGDTVKTSKVISQFEAELADEPCFLRCHQSCIVNLNKVKKTDDEYVYLKNGKRLLISIRDKQWVRKTVADFYWAQTREVRDGYE